MESIYTLLFVLQVIVAVALIGFVLIQHGKGADAGAAFGSGSSSTVFGSRGSASFLTKLTTFLAAIFLINSLLLAHLASKKIKEAPGSLLDTPSAVVEQEEATEELAVPSLEDSNGQEDNDNSIPDLPIQ